MYFLLEIEIQVVDCKVQGGSKQFEAIIDLEDVADEVDS